jgi:hypothetical protein
VVIGVDRGCGGVELVEPDSVAQAGSARFEQLACFAEDDIAFAPVARQSGERQADFSDHLRIEPCLEIARQQPRQEQPRPRLHGAAERQARSAVDRLVQMRDVRHSNLPAPIEDHEEDWCQDRFFFREKCCSDNGLSRVRAS